MKATRRFFRLLELDRKDIGYIYIYALFAGLITLSLPLGTQAIISLLVGGQTSSSLYLLVAVITIATAFNGILKVMQLTVTETLQRRIFTRSAFEFAWRIPRLRLEALSDIYPPELINRFFDTLTIQKGIPKILIDFSSAVLQIIFGLILLSLYHPFFVFFSALLLLILALIFWITGPQGLKTSLKESKYKYQVAHWLEELGRAMNIFKLSGSCNLPMQRTNDLTNNYLGARKSHFRILLMQYGSIVLFKTVVTGALLLLGSLLVIQNQISIGQFVAAEIVVILILGSAEKLILTMETIYDVLTGLEKIGYLTDLPLERGEGVSFEEICETGDGIGIEIDGLSFQYADAQKPTLNNIELNIKKGERICIAGYNGSGKSTLAQLVAGLYTQFDGMITYNGVPLRSLNIESLREHVGSLGTQDELFNASILENITLGEDIGLKQVIEIARNIDLHHYINHLPHGYNAELLAGGVNVPRSVRAKIILARAIIANPSLLVIDHFIPRIEQQEKRHIIDFLTNKSKKWTLFAVSSNPELARKCDRIILLKDGEIVVEGHFNDLQKNPYVQDVFKLTDNEAVTAAM